MKTKNILLPALAIAMFATPVIAQNYGNLLHQADRNEPFLYHFPTVVQDYHDEIEPIRQALIADIPAPTFQKPYLDVGSLYNQMFEDLSPINCDKLFLPALNSVKDNKISAKQQYELMKIAIEQNYNDVLGTLLGAGFKANIEVELEKDGIKVIPLAEIAQKSKNKEALNLIELYTPKLQTK